MTNSYPVTAWSLHNLDGTTWTKTNVSLNNFLPKSTHILTRTDLGYSYTLLLRATVSVGFTFDQTLQIRVCGEETLQAVSPSYTLIIPYESAPLTPYFYRQALESFFLLKPANDVCTFKEFRLGTGFNITDSATNLFTFVPWEYYLSDVIVQNTGV